MTLQELRKALNNLDVDWVIKTENTYSDERRGNNLVTVRFWVEEETNASTTNSR